MNKLAVLAFTLLIFFSTMLWYLANGSLNEYLKSQIALQGHYYSGYKTTVEIADFSPNTGIAKFEQLNLIKDTGIPTFNIININKAQIKLSAKQTEPLITLIDTITIEQLTLNIVKTAALQTNIDKLTEQIMATLASDFPKLYPEISAKQYAANNPQLNAEEYAKKHPEAGPIIAHKKPNKQRGKPQHKVAISNLHIKNLVLNYRQGDNESSLEKQNIKITNLTDKEGFLINQLGGEILLTLLEQAKIVTDT